MNLPAFALRRKAFTIVAALLACVVGAIAFQTAPRKEDPTFTIRDAIVITPWPGATVYEVERLVTDPIEQQLAATKLMRKMDSTSYAGYSSMQITLLDEFSDADAAWDKVRRELSLVKTKLPPGVGEPYLIDHISQAAVFVLCVHQDPETLAEYRYTPRQLDDFSRAVRDRMMDLRPTQVIDGVETPISTEPSFVERADTWGAQQEVVYVETDMANWSQLGVSGPQLATYLRSRNVVVPGGTVTTDDTRYHVSLTGDFDAVEQIRSAMVGRVTAGGGQAKSTVPIAAAAQQTQAGNDTYRDGPAAALTQNVPVRLSDLDIEVRRDYLDPPMNLTRYSDQVRSSECVVLAFTMKKGVNIGAFEAAVDQLLDRANTTFLPPDIVVAKGADQPRAVAKKVDEVVSNVVSSVAVVLGVLILMAGLRIATIAAIAIPAIMLMGIGAMRLFGVEIEQMSLASLIIALGILVDNTIQVCDNTQSHIDAGEDPEVAAVHGPNEIGFPILIATLTILASFLPLLFTLTGSTVEYVRSIPIVVSLTLGLGWLFAMTVTPIMARYALKPGTGGSPIPRWLAAIRARFGAQAAPDPAPDAPGGSKPPSAFHRMVVLAVRAKWLTIGLGYGFLVLVVLLPLSTDFFPLSDRNQFVVDIYLPDGTSIQKTDETTARVEEIVRALGRGQFVDGSYEPLPDGENRLENMFTMVGTGGPFNWIGVYPKPDEPNYAVMWLNTRSGDDVVPFVRDLRIAARRGIGDPGSADYLPPIAGARVVPHQLVQGIPTVSPIDIRLLGPRLGSEEVLRVHGRRLEQALRDTGLVFDVHNSWGDYRRQVDIDVDQQRSNLAGVGNAAVALAVNAYYSGHPLIVYREGDRQIPVLFRLPPSERKSLDQLGQVYVEGVTGKVPLESIATISQDWQPGKINRWQRERNWSVRAQLEQGVLFSDVVGAVQPALDEISADLPAGYRIEHGGVKEEADKGAAQNGQALAIGAALIFVLLIVQFNSTVKPLLILLTLPLAAAGGILGLVGMGVPLGFMETIGMLALFGIVLSAGILLIEFSGILVGRRLASGDGVAAEGEKSYSGLSRDAFLGSLASATELRLMPILMTTLTTVGGLVSLMFAGGPLFKGLSTVIVIGLSIGTLFTLFVLPALIAAFVQVFGIDIATRAES